jgi:hypothetical protein
MSTIHDPAPTRHRWARLIGMPVAAVSLAGLVACGSSAAATSASGSGGAQASDSAMQAFASCLAENGVTLPQRGNGGTRPSGAPSAGGAGSGDGSAPPTGAPPAGGTGGSAGGAAGGGAMPAPPGVDATTWAAARKACAPPTS